MGLSHKLSSKTADRLDVILSFWTPVARTLPLYPDPSARTHESCVVSCSEQHVSHIPVNAALLFNGSFCKKETLLYTIGYRSSLLWYLT